MISFWDEYHNVIGVLVLATWTFVLFSAPEAILHDVEVVDVNLYYKTNYERIVYMSMDFYNQSDIENFPKKIMEWDSDIFPPTKYELDVLKPDVLLLRIYHNKEKNIKFVLVHASNMSSFHDPKVCYRAGGFDVEDMGIENVSIFSNTSPIYVNSIMIEKGGNKEAVLYWFMWGKGKIKSKESAIMVRISTEIQGDTNSSINLLKNFTSQILPIMYKETKQSKILAVLLLDAFGFLGILIIIIVYGVILSASFYTEIRALIKNFRKIK